MRYGLKEIPFAYLLEPYGQSGLFHLVYQLSIFALKLWSVPKIEFFIQFLVNNNNNKYNTFADNFTW